VLFSHVSIDFDKTKTSVTLIDWKICLFRK